MPRRPARTVANIAQQDYFADVAAKVVLPMFKARDKPFVIVFWSRDPDGTQHNKGDSLNTLTPGINGPTSLAGIRNADNDLAQMREALDDLGLAATTDIIVTADHGFSTISKQSETSPSAKVDYATCRRVSCRRASSRIDLAKALDLPLFNRTAQRRASPTAPIPRPAAACSATIPQSPRSWSPPMAARI